MSKIKITFPDSSTKEYNSGISCLEIVKGIRRAIAIGELKPGNAPTNTPIKTPDNIKSIF